MKNIIGDIKAYIQANVTLYGAITEDNYGTAIETLMIRGDPSTVRETPYLDGGCIGVQLASVYARSKNPSTAIASLESIATALDDRTINLNEVLSISGFQLTAPLLVSKDEAGVSVYTVTFRFEYERG